MSKQLEQAGLVTFEDEVKRDYRWNFTANLLVVVIFSMGMSFASLNTVLPAFARHLTSSNLLIGLIPSLSTLGWLLPQILIANFTQKLKRKKGLLVFAGLAERIPWFLLFLAVMLLSSQFLSEIGYQNLRKKPTQGTKRGNETDEKIGGGKMACKSG